MTPNNDILIVGIGNVLRGDDGIGAHIVSRIEQLNLTGVNTMTMQQLHIEMLDDFLPFNHIVLVDASVAKEGVAFYPLKKQHSLPSPSSHQVNAVLLNALTKQLYQKELPMMLCAVKGECFDMGEQLSATAKKNADNAIGIICKWIRNKHL